MSKTTWADARKGDGIELQGRVWRLVKIKPSGKKAKVTIEYKGRESSAVVKLKDRVTITEYKGKVQRSDGSQRRWATEAELKKAMTRGLEPGDPARTRPPAKAKGGEWDERAKKGTAERRLVDTLGATLVAEARNEAAGYNVPPVDVSTIAAHLAVFHGGIPEAVIDDYSGMIAAHDAQHGAAKKGEGVLAVNHWHTERRP